jgi:hypothetical protein
MLPKKSLHETLLQVLQERVLLETVLQDTAQL